MNRDLFFNELDILLKKCARERLDYDAVKRRLELLLKEFYKIDNLKDILVQYNKRIYKFYTENLADTDTYRYANKVFDQFIPYYANQKIGIRRDVQNVIKEAFRKDWNSERMRTELLQRVELKYTHYADTITRSAVSSFTRAFDAVESKKNGVDKFIYLGDPPQRPFCKKYYGKIMTRNEIAELSKRVGRDVLIFAGGFSCRHAWKPYVD